MRGIICHTPSKERLEIRENAYIVCLGGICEGIFDDVPEQYRGLRLIDCKDRLVIPGLTDLHIHAPQYSFIGTGMDYELLEWLDQKAFPEEIRYQDTAYAEKAYDIFAEKLRKSATTRAVIFGTIHRKAALALMDRMEKTGLVSFVGKVNMDRNAPEELLEKDYMSAALETRQFLEDVKKKGYKRTKPIITPRFVISCSDRLLEELGKLQKESGLPVQSHLSENPEEVQLVRKLVPEAGCYGDAYDRFGLFGRGAPTVMAHCVHSIPEEVRLIKKNGVWVAHCPGSNMNLASGIAPVKKYLDMGIHVGLGTDVAGGSSVSMFRAVTDAVQVSKLYKRCIEPSVKPLTFTESFYLATKGGGSFFGKAGSFEKGYEFDAVVLDDPEEVFLYPVKPRERLERAFYLGADKKIVRKIAAGKEIVL